MFKRLLILVLAVIMAMTMFACGGSSTPAADQPSTQPAENTEGTDQTKSSEESKSDVEALVLKLSGAFPEGTAHYVYFDEFCKKVDEYSGGTLNVVWGNGPEAIPSNELAEALMGDVVELVHSPVAYMVSHMPVLTGLKLMDPQESRVNGGVDFINELTEKGLNAHFLGRCNDGVSFTIALNKEIESLDDFDGLTIRGTSAQIPLLKKLGAGVVSMPQGELYNALERNVVDGAGCGLTDIVDNSLYDVCKYFIQPGFYNSDSSLFVAMGTWNKLNDVQKDALTKAAIDWERESLVYNKKVTEEALKTITEGGMEIIELEGQMREDWLRLAYEGCWEEVLAADPEVAEEMEKFISQ
jgi:TRAP-type C4-dicarboxylate transport system substrate-binding protein